MNAAAGSELATWPLDEGDVAAWRGLAVERENPFVTPDWIEAGAEVLAERPLLVLWREHGELAGVLPLVEGRRGRVATLCFPGRIAGDLFEPVCRPGREEELSAVAASLLATAPGWQALELDRALGAEHFSRAFSGAWPGRGRPRVVGGEDADVFPYIELESDSVDGWLAGRSKNLRKDLRKRRRLLDEAGARVRTTTGHDRLEEDFAILERLHRARWGGGDAAPGEKFWRLLHNFAARAAEHGWLRLSVLELEGEPVAATYGWRLGDRYIDYMSCYDPAFREHGVGVGILLATLEAAIAEGADVYDLMRGDEDYKRRLESGRREATSMIVARPRSIHGYALALGAQAEGLGRRLPDGPRAHARRAYRLLRRR